MPEYDNYQSPFSWRYGTPAMRHLWSEANKRLIWRQLWVALAEVQSEFGLVTAEQVADLRTHMTKIDIPRALEIETLIQHDLMAELHLFAEQSPLGGAVLHLGTTSADIEDNADAIRLSAALDLILESLSILLRTVGRLVEKWAETPVMGFTHLQPAEPTTLGYRLALYGQDLLDDYRSLGSQRLAIRGKGFKGAVGTSATFADLVGLENLPVLEQKLSKKLHLPLFPVASQVYPRKQDYFVISALAGLGATLYKIALDLRILQSPPIGELSEPFGEKQVGSSAMPFKRNPVRAEKVDSLARYLATLPRIAWDNAANSMLERTLDDSANRRIILPEAFLALDEILRTTNGMLSNLQVNEAEIKNNLAVYGPFSASERVLMALVKAGADRQDMHERIRGHSMKVWEAIRQGAPNDLADRLCGDAEIVEYLPPPDIVRLMNISSYVGDAPQRAHHMAKTIEDTISRKE